MLYFCTYFDSCYVHKGLALYRSLERTGEEFTLWMLTFDEATFAALSALHLAHARLIRRADFEAGDDDLVSACRNRRLFEYYWTCTPTLLLRILESEPSVDVLTYLDADMAFYETPSILVDELGNGNILLNPQDVSNEYRHSAVSGRFNVGVNTFRRSETTFDALRWWRQCCLEQCRYSPEHGAYGDQHYLDDWPDRFPGVVISEHVGLRMAPWNTGRYPIRHDGTRFRVMNYPLVCFHFHAVRFCAPRFVWIAGWNTTVDPAARAKLYRPYVHQLVVAEADLAACGHPIRLPLSGIPWRYVAGRVLKGQPVRHFLWLRADRENQ